MSKSQPGRPPNWLELTPGSILRLGSCPSTGFSDPRCFPEAALHPGVVLEIRGDHCAIVTMTSFKKPNHGAHKIQIDRIQRGWAIPCKHNDTANLGLALLEVESRRAILNAPSGEGDDDNDDETDDGVAGYLDWNPDQFLDASLVQPFRIHVLHGSELWNFEERGRWFRVSASSMPLIKQALQGRFRGFLTRTQEFLAAVEPQRDQALIAAVTSKHQPLYSALTRQLSLDKERVAALNRQVSPPSANPAERLTKSDETTQNSVPDNATPAHLTESFQRLLASINVSRPQNTTVIPQLTAGDLVKFEQSDDEWKAQCNAINPARMENIPALLLNHTRCKLHGHEKACACFWAAMESKFGGFEAVARLKEVSGKQAPSKSTTRR